MFEAVDGIIFRDLEAVMNHKQKIHEWIRQFVTKEDYVVDATSGNGHDTLFLAQIAGHVDAIDIQIDAINSTKKRLQAMTNVTYYHMNHADYIYDKDICGAVFNLGYLPGGDKSIVSQVDSTVTAISHALDHCRLFVVVACYLKHPGGLEEFEAVQHLLSQKKDIIIETLTYDMPLSPVTFLIQKEQTHALR